MTDTPSPWQRPLRASPGRGSPLPEAVRSAPLRKLAVLLAAGAVAAFLSPWAEARTYEVHSCRGPDGSSAGTAGWTAENTPGVRALNNCARGGALGVEFTNRSGGVGSHGVWKFDAPPDTELRGFQVWRYARVHHTTTSNPTHYSAYDGPLERCYAKYSPCRSVGRPSGDPFDPRNLRSITPAAPDNLYFSIGCFHSNGAPGCTGWAEPFFYMTAARITLSDSNAPTVSGLGGALASERNVHGQASLTVYGHDRGSGIARIRLFLDGRPFREDSFDPANSTCRSPFKHPRPCALNGSRRLSVDTNRIPDGDHALGVAIVDASGNPSATLGLPLHVNNGGASCAYGSGPRLRAGFGRSRSRRLTLRSSGSVTTRGELLDVHRRPIPGASVRMLTKPAYSQHFTDVAVLRTDRRGRLRVRLTGGPSRRIRLSYCARQGGHHRDIYLGVRSAVSLRSSRRRARNGSRIVFSGRVRSRPLPRTGKLVELQAYFRGRWRTFQTLHTRRRGSFSFGYTFGGTSGTVRYRFRARVPREHGFPFSTGLSRQVNVRVTG